MSDELLLILVEKGLLAAVLALVVHLLARQLAALKSDLQSRSQTELKVAEARMPGYAKLWQLTERTGFTRRHDLTEHDRHELFEALRAWYFDEGGGLYLSAPARNAFFGALNFLVGQRLDPGADRLEPLEPAPDWSTPEAHEQCRKRFSALRSELKADLRIFEIGGAGR